MPFSEVLVTPAEFLSSAIKFVAISDQIQDEWKLYENTEIHKSYIKKDTFLTAKDCVYKAEFVIFYNLSYGVPGFSFNVWDSSGSFLSLEGIRQLSLLDINQEDFYSVITQQEHPVLCRPYFVMHPCHTEVHLASLKESKNCIVTILGLITPLIPLKLPFAYGL
ncbi:unnamed protein product [Leptidea sinapis]|uniref:Ubiquitin-like-conjugating enzyme ATG10 n=1 Tax=Leptidea sinapis TaxID=189913 RepID=A0A5E4PTA0_9NEOP|nr:unnamed protein product [Leptidea sinapis]